MKIIMKFFRNGALLLFVLLSTSCATDTGMAVNDSSGIQIALPAVHSDTESQMTVLIFIPDDKSVYVRSKECTTSNFIQELDRIALPERSQIVVKVQGSVAYGIVARILGISHKEGYQKISLAVESE